jgi:D-serine deaminase-like pyridoxal phosphate-dependent protein
MTSIQDIQTPALLLDLDKFEKNCAFMKDKAKKLNVVLRPHLKTGKCWNFAKIQMTSAAGPATVSTLLEAEYFFDCGVRDMIYAVGITPAKLPRAASLIRRGADLKVLVDNVFTAREISRFCQENKISIPVLIEIDCDGHRSGVKPDSALLLDIAAALKAPAKFAGILTHAGDSYKCYGEEACLKAQENERDSLVFAANRLKDAGYPAAIISAGSTPTARFARDWTGVTEVRCGVYSVFDLVMAGLGVCTADDIALSLLVEVIGHQEEKGWVITDGGWMALSRDRGTAAQPVDQGYGLVCDLTGKPVDDLIVSSANQEHGIISSRSGKPLPADKYPVGTKFRILPNHACAMAAQHPQYFVIKDGKLKEIWKRFYGWQ